MAGVSLAWLLDGAREVVLFESRDSVGGNVLTIDVNMNDSEGGEDQRRDAARPRGGDGRRGVGLAAARASRTVRCQCETGRTTDSMSLASGAPGGSCARRRDRRRR